MEEMRPRRGGEYGRKGGLIEGTEEHKVKSKIRYTINPESRDKASTSGIACKRGINRRRLSGRSAKDHGSA
jgi:hypothetical protein